MFNCFKKPQQDSIGYGESDVQLEGYTWGYIVPHTKKASGAESIYRVSEYGYGRLIAQNFTRWSTRDSGGVRGACEHLKDIGANASFEDHKNAFNGSAAGAEILVLWGDELSYEIAVRILDDFCTKFNRKNRGVKRIKRGGRGYNNLKTAKKYFKVVLLGEMFFIDNPDEFIDYTAYGNWLKGVLV